MAQPMLAAPRHANGHGTVEPQAFSVPARHNPRLQALVERLNGDDELRQLWRCANVNAVERLGLGDSGEVHVRIVANAALKLLRLLRDAGEIPGVSEHHRLPPDEAEVVVVLAAALHDLSLAVEPAAAQGAGLALAAYKARELLTGMYPVRERTILLAETMHVISGVAAGAPCLTLEASVLTLADALDMTKGRVRLPPAGAGTAVMVDEVLIQRHREPPVRVVIGLSLAVSAEPVEALLRPRLQPVRLHGQVELVARVGTGGQERLLPIHAWADA